MNDIKIIILMVTYQNSSKGFFMEINKINKISVIVCFHKYCVVKYNTKKHLNLNICSCLVNARWVLTI